MMEELYVVVRLDVTPDRFDLPEEERNKIVDQMGKTLSDVGGETVLSLGRHEGNGMVIVTRFPDAKAYRSYNRALWDLKIKKYWTMEVDLCFKAVQE